MEPHPPQHPDKRRDLIEGLSNGVVPEIKDEKLARLLRDAQQDPTKNEDVLAHLRKQLEAARKLLLYSGQNGAANVHLSMCYRERENRDILLCWQSLISDATHVARTLNERYQDNVDDGYYRRIEDGRSLARKHAGYVVDALRFALLARCCQVRANVNLTVLDEKREKDAFDKPIKAVKRLRTLRRQYSKQVRQWKLAFALIPGKREEADAKTFSIWRSDFGHLREGELGWPPFSRAASIEFRFQAYWIGLIGMSKQQVFRYDGSRPVLGKAVTAAQFPLLLVRDVLGYGILWFILVVFWGFTFLALHPKFFAGLTIALIPFFSALYALDEAFFRDNKLLHEGLCHSLDFSPAGLWRLLYYSTVNLTSLGPDGPGCGRHVTTIISFESLTGYFLLSVLAAMFFAWLTNR